MHCHSGAEAIDIIATHTDWLQLLCTLFMTGLATSFSHCIWMCGPIAMSQMSMRLMLVPHSKMSEAKKIRSAAAIPYYIGKAITYSILAIISSLVSLTFSAYPFFKFLGTSLLLIMVLFFIKSGIISIFSILVGLMNLKRLEQYANISDVSYIKKAINFLEITFIHKISLLNISPYNFQGLILGMILGLIPCGIVYASIGVVIANSDDFFIIALAMFMFGIGTIPGLFLVSYVGSSILERHKKIFKGLHACVMFFNAFLLARYIVRILN